MRVSRAHVLIPLFVGLFLPACDGGERQTRGVARKIAAGERQPQVDAGKITIGVVRSKSAIVEPSYPCRVESAAPVFVHSPVPGRVAAILVKEGQALKRGDLLFKIKPDEDGRKSPAQGGDGFASIKAPCDGRMSGFRGPGEGDRVRKGTHVLTLLNGGVVRVHFEIPETLYLELMDERGLAWKHEDLYLTLADRSHYPHVGRIVNFLAGRAEGGPGSIRAAAEFPNPDGVLHRGQAGTLSMKRVVRDAILLIPRRASFEGPDLWKRFVYVVDRDHVAHRREVVIEDGEDDLSVVQEGVGVGDRIIVDGVGQVHDGDKVE